MRKQAFQKILIASGILAVFGGSFYAMINYGGARKVNDANNRVFAALNNIDVYVKTGATQSSTTRLNQFIQQVSDDENENFYPTIDMTVDFTKILSGIRRDDLDLTRGKFPEYEQNIYEKLGLLFDKTDDLSVNVINIDKDALKKYTIPDDYKEIREYSIPIRRFLKTDSKTLRLESKYCDIYVNSEFFYGKAKPESGTRDFSLFDADIRFYIKIDDGDPENIIVEIMLKDGGGNEILHENPGKSILLRIPLSLDFMRYADTGALRFDAAQYVDTVNKTLNVLPRSYADNKYLYISSNRTGRYRLIKTAHGNNGDKASFLKDRGIQLSAKDDTEPVTRGDFFNALMQIYWVEGLKFESYAEPFPDIINNEKLQLKINVAKNLGILVGHTPDAPFGKNEFKPDGILTRDHLFVILERFINVFEINVKDVMPTDGAAKWSPAKKVKWREAADAYINQIKDEFVGYREGIIASVANLESIGFMPYYSFEDENYIAADEPLRCGDAVGLLYNLVTAVDF